MMQGLQERKRIAELAIQAVIRPEGDVARSYSVERVTQDGRLAMLLTLAKSIPVGRQFATLIDLAMWAYATLESHPQGMTTLVRERAMYAVGILWTSLEEAGGAATIEDHGSFLLDVAVRARGGYYRTESVQAVAS